MAKHAWKFIRHFISGAVSGAIASYTGGHLTVKEIAAGALAGGLAGVGLGQIKK